MSSLPDSSALTQVQRDHPYPDRSSRVDISDDERNKKPPPRTQEAQGSLDARCVRPVRYTMVAYNTTSQMPKRANPPRPRPARPEAHAAVPKVRVIRPCLLNSGGFSRLRLAAGLYIHLVEDVPNGCSVFGGSIVTDGDQDVEVAVLVGEPEPVDGANVGTLV